MRKIVARSAAVLAAAAASLFVATAAPASAAPTGPVSLSANASPDGESIELTYTNHMFVGTDTCVSTARNVGDGETITTNTPAPFFPPTTTVTLTPTTAGLYEITFTCPAILGWGGPSSSNDTPLFVTITHHPIGGPAPFGS